MKKKPAVAIVCFLLLCLFIFGVVESKKITGTNSSAPSSAEVHLEATLSNSFTLNWFEDMSRLDSILTNINDLETEKEKNPAYLLGYIESDMNTNSSYLRLIFTDQVGLKKAVISQKLQVPLGNFSVAESNYMRNLKNSIIKEKNIPKNESFQKNTQKLAKLIDDLFVSTDDLRKEKELTEFENNLEEATICMNAAFSNK